VMKDSSDHKKYASLSFPGASQVDVYPAEHLSDYWGYFGVSGSHDKTDITLPNENLLLSEYVILDQGVGLDEYKASMKALALEAIDFDNTVKSRDFHVTSMFPFKLPKLPIQFAGKFAPGTTAHTEHCDRIITT
ncbi:hypothetical protein BaRGS_00036073, partial [Batillaria attramentaria]